MRPLAPVILRCLAALAGTTLGWAAAIGLFFIATGGSRDLPVVAIFIAMFCLAAWVFAGIPLAVLNPAFPTARAKAAAIGLGGITGAAVVLIALGRAAAIFATQGFVAGAVSMTGYILLAPQPAAHQSRFRRVGLVLLAGAVLAGSAALPLSFSFGRILESRRTVTAMMTWEPEGAAPGDGVVLRFADDPSYFMVDYMPGLLRHLEASGKRTVAVEFAAYSDFRGAFKGYSVLKIDGLPYRPDPLGRGRAGQTGAGLPGARRRHPLDVFGGL